MCVYYPAQTSSSFLFLLYLHAPTRPYSKEMLRHNPESEAARAALTEALISAGRCSRALEVAADLPVRHTHTDWRRRVVVVVVVCIC